jgi:hypothetical protein
MTAEIKEQSMRKLLFAALAAIFMSGTAFADSDIQGVFGSLNDSAKRQSVERVTGKSMFAGAGGATSLTLDTFDWGFKSNFVKLCVQAGATVNTPAYLQFGVGNVDNVSTSNIFIDGPDSTDNPTIFNTRAKAITGGGDGSDQFCTTQAWRTTGLSLHSVTSGTITVDVWAW